MLEKVADYPQETGTWIGMDHVAASGPICSLPILVELLAAACPPSSLRLLSLNGRPRPMFSEQTRAGEAALLGLRALGFIALAHTHTLRGPHGSRFLANPVVVIGAFVVHATGFMQFLDDVRVTSWCNRDERRGVDDIAMEVDRFFEVERRPLAGEVGVRHFDRCVFRRIWALVPAASGR
jgi:hypothetical protein